ncbi:TonB-dependent receptor [Alistipes megaguti]|uniref:TonB-dependent receptor n=1 Tax=Alistipes megaguti TaxID=2364787 RepID=UPI002356CBAA|nr:TonB-dependent receptor [Alistipes megaguti]
MKPFRLLLAAVLLVASVTAVSAQQVTVRLRQVKLVQVLDEISRQTGYAFYHSRPTVDPDRIVSLDVTDTKLETALDRLFAGTRIGYEIRNQKIYLVAKNDPQNEATRQQPRPVKGQVKDAAGEPVIGATVVVKGTTKGASTGIDGGFTLDVTPDDVLVVSYIGYDTQEIPVGSRTSFDIQLREEATTLDDVVVIGYGAVKKRDVSTAISSIKAEDIANRPITDFRQSMAGKMPGVQVMQTGGDPEGNVMVRVRGISSATAGNDPLYIVDGVPMENGLSNLNTNDIESMEVLKDASSAAIYGSRGSNGVILITTKKGKSETIQVTYDGYYGIEQVSKKIDLMNAYQYAQVSKEAHDAAYLDQYPGGTAPNGDRPESYMNYPVELVPYLNGEPGLTDTDWQDAIFRTASTTSHNIAISGKGKHVNYFISGNYYYKEGVIINSDFERYSFRMNLDGKYKNFKYGVNFSPSYSKSNKVNASGDYNSGGIVQSALTSCPIWPIYNEDGTFNFQGNGYWRIGTDYQHNEILNPVALATLQSEVIDRMSMTGRAFLGYDICKGLSFQTSFGGSFYGAIDNKYRSSELPLRGKAYYDAPSNPEGYSSAGFYFNWLIENQLTYDRTFGDHSLNVILVQSAQKETYKTLNVTATDYPNDQNQTIGGGTVSDGDSKTEQWSLASYLARVQYNYKGKYMLSAAIRADGSSRFGKNNRWGYFPSASAAWRISGEPFFQNAEALSWISDLKIRASYGQTGNFQIGNYRHLATMSGDDYILGTGSGSLVSGYKPSDVENPDLTWEKTSMFNVGADLSLLGGYFNLTAEYYYANTTDMLLEVPIPHLTGYSTTLMNIGKVNNRGWELSATSQHSYANGISYSLNVNWAKNTNEVKALGANDTPIIQSGSVDHAYYITKVGEPIGSYYLLVQDGIFRNEEDLKAYPHVSTAQPGDFRFVDVDGDGEIDLEKDRTIVGNYMPDFTYGFGGSFGYRGLDFSVAFQGVHGNEILNLNRRYLDNMEGNTNGTTVAFNRWKSPTEIGDGNTNRANRKQTGNNTRTSTWHVEDGSYLRLQNIALGYTLPAKWTRKFYVEKLRIYVSAQNLVTWTDYSGYNPEVSNRTSALTPGEDYGTYPLAKTYMVGLNVTF